MIENTPNEEVILTEDQKDKIKKSFEGGACPDLSDLTREVFGNDKIDGRSKEGRTIKKYIAEFQIGKVKVRAPQKAVLLNLTDEQKKLIIESYKKKDFSILSFTRELYKNQDITAFFVEYKTVNDFINKLELENQKLRFQVEEGDELQTLYYNPENLKPDHAKEKEYYRPPSSLTHCIARINKYLNYGWKEEHLKKSQIKCVESLTGYLRVFRFQYQINTYSRSDDRELFEDAFIRYTHDKDDLTQEELDQFITLSNEVVIAADIQRRIDYLRMALDDMASDSEGKKISMGLNEAINNAQTEYNQCISRQDKLYKSLTVNRSKRIEEKRNENASILNLVYAWKQEENRERMIALAERQREAMKEEVEKLSSMDEFKAIIRGIDPKEIFNT